MSLLRSELKRYLEFRRVRGFKLKGEERFLLELIVFMERRQAELITLDLCTEWNASTPATHGHRQRRIIAVRGFAGWMKSINMRHEVPPPYRGQVGKNRPKPYIFTQRELEALVEQSGRLTSKNGLNRLTYATLWPFLYVTGLRIGEALALDLSSFDFKNNTVRIPPMKGGYERLVPLHPTTAAALQSYLRKRNRLLAAKPRWFFASEEGLRLKDDTARQSFNAIGKRIGLRPSEPFTGDGKGPRIHDLRHTFAVNTLLQWYREGKDIDEHILTLVDVLGHSSIRKTYWYLEAVPELLGLALERVRPLGGGGNAP